MKSRRVDDIFPIFLECVPNLWRLAKVVFIPKVGKTEEKLIDRRNSTLGVFGHRRSVRQQSIQKYEMLYSQGSEKQRDFLDGQYVKE